MPIQDKVAAAKKIDELLRAVLPNGGFRLKYKITVGPPREANDATSEWESPDILVDFSGPDAGLILARGAELMRSMEHLATKALRLEMNEHDRVSFDCEDFKRLRREELKVAADVAAERVRKSGSPYEFAPMNSRERRLVHLALRDSPDLKTESTGEGSRRAVVVMPKDYKAAFKPKPFGRRR